MVQALALGQAPYLTLRVDVIIGALAALESRETLLSLWGPSLHLRGGISVVRACCCGLRHPAEASALILTQSHKARYKGWNSISEMTEVDGPTPACRWENLRPWQVKYIAVLSPLGNDLEAELRARTLVPSLVVSPFIIFALCLIMKPLQYF